MEVDCPKDNKVAVALPLLELTKLTTLGQKSQLKLFENLSSLPQPLHPSALKISLSASLFIPSLAINSVTSLAL